MNTKLCVLTICLVSLLLAACGDTSPVPPTLPPDAVMPATLVAPKGPMISGHVLWGTASIPGAQVELRTGAWADPDAGQTIALTTADEAGQYQLEAPPAGGEFGLVAVWPDGGANRAPVTPLQVAAGTATVHADVCLAKELKVLAPAPGAEVGPMPTLEWEALANATQYRVWVIDAGTTQAALDQVTTGASLTVGAPLTAGVTYRWVVNSLTADGKLLANLTSEFKVVAPTTAKAEPCQGEGLATYTSQTDGYCFAYPQGFELTMSDFGQPVVSGPALDASPDPLRAKLVIIAEVAARDKSLAEIVDGYVASFSGLPVPPIERTTITLGGETGEMLQVVPGREGSREIMVLRQGELFHLMFTPSVRDFPAAQADVEALYRAVTQTWAFGEGPGGTVELPTWVN